MPLGVGNGFKLKEEISVVKDRKKILFVDDEESILDIAREYFSVKHYDVLVARDGFEAIQILDKEEVDCCITDINMPGMNGVELAENINKKNSTLPVVIMTAYPSIENTIKTLKNGVVDFLIKPINLSQMELCVEKVLRQREIFIENLLLKKEVKGKERIEKLNRELTKKNDELVVLNKIMSDFIAMSSTSDVFKRVAEMVLEISDADEAGFYVINEALKNPLQVVKVFSDNAKIEMEPYGEWTEKRGASENSIKSSNENQYEQLIMEVASDKLPLLVAESTEAKRIQREIRSLIFVPLMIREKVFGVLTATIYKNNHRFTEKDLYYLSFMTNKASYAIENILLYENIYDNLFSTLYAFVKAIEVKDPYTEQHSNRVTDIALSIAREMGCSEEDLEILNVAGRLHDIGKIGISDNILLKPAKLTAEESKKIREHPDIGADIVGQLGLWDSEQKIIRYHHERVDGKGFPRGLKKDEIPLLVRILSVSDAYDAMASDRSYRKKMGAQQIIDILKNESGAQFDPDIINVFLKLHKEGKIKK